LVTFAGGDRVRLDQFLVDSDLGLTRSQIKKLVEAGDVQVNGAACKVGHRLHRGDQVRVVVPEPASARALPQTIPLTVLYEDLHLIVVDKPAGLVVHPAPGHPDGTLVNALLGHCTDLSGVGGELRPGIVHRLDKDTSGVMVASKDDDSHHRLVELFKSKAIMREYLAVVAPGPTANQGTFDTLHGRHLTHRKKFSSRVPRGKRAVTHYTVEQRFACGAALVRCQLATGRTHQIRVHFADHGMPVVGDSVYGRGRGPTARLAAPYLARQALHAAVLGFTHPITGQALRFASPLPADMQALISALVIQPGQ
jgi:23S rRNA pseudouridine1911/1915/1917 synthase